MRALLMIYLSGAILLLGLSTMIEEDDVSLDHILIAAFGWPIITPLLALRAWTSR